MTSPGDTPGPPPSLGDSTVAIVGLGLLGGSLARALAFRCTRVIGVVEPGDEDTRRTALALEIVDDVADLDSAVERADIVVLATPVRETIALLPSVAQTARAGTLVTDVGSSKAAVVAAMDAAGGEAVYAGGHPMCGGTTAGLTAVDPELFRGARWAICAAGASPDAGVARLAQFAEAVGADPIIVEPDEHDRAVALVSHLPRIVAVSLVSMLERRPPELPLAGILAGRGWDGATRLARGDERMWGDVLTTNAAEVAAAARELAAELARVAAQLEDGARSH